jgi:hypothetical protein
MSVRIKFLHIFNGRFLGNGIGIYSESKPRQWKDLLLLVGFTLGVPITTAEGSRASGKPVSMEGDESFQRKFNAGLSSLTPALYQPMPTEDAQSFSLQICNKP